jgi:hypothetical protein
VSVSAVVKWKKLGRVLVLPSGQIDVQSSDAMLAARPEVYRGGVIGGTPKGGGAGSQGSKATARAIATKETYLALSHKLDYERAVGRIVDIDVVTSVVARDYTVMRNRIMGVGIKTGMRLAACDDAKKCQAIIDEEMARALECLDAEAAYDEIRRLAGLVPASE